MGGSSQAGQLDDRNEPPRATRWVCSSLVIRAMRLETRFEHVDEQTEPPLVVHFGMNLIRPAKNVAKRRLGWYPRRLAPPLRRRGGHHSKLQSRFSRRKGRCDVRPPDAVLGFEYGPVDRIEPPRGNRGHQRFAAWPQLNLIQAGRGFAQIELTRPFRTLQTTSRRGLVAQQSNRTTDRGLNSIRLRTFSATRGDASTSISKMAVRHALRSR